MKKRLTESGFTAVELLVTLFVAAAFLIAGYQLFTVVIRDGGETRAESLASNVAYDYLRQYAGNVTTPCSVQAPLVNEPITIDTLVNVTATVEISCPNPAAPGVSKITVFINYNNPPETVEYATYTVEAL